MKKARTKCAGFSEFLGGCHFSGTKKRDFELGQAMC